MIPPTVGRVIWVWPSADVRSHAILDPTQPFTASIAYVHSDTDINVAGADHLGTSFQAQHVPLWDGETERPAVVCWQWMPYQKGQAAKTEALEAAVRDGYTKP